MYHLMHLVNSKKLQVMCQTYELNVPKLSMPKLHLQRSIVLFLIFKIHIPEESTILQQSMPFFAVMYESRQGVGR
jgi:hypothetical protein